MKTQTSEIKVGCNTLEIRKAKNGYRATIGTRLVVGPKSKIKEVFALFCEGVDPGKAIVMVLWK